MTNTAIQGLWIGTKLSVMERLSIESFLAHGHDYHLYTYEPIRGVPSRTIICDANEILPKSFIFEYRQYRSFAGFSNYFRYFLLLKKGGWWVDLDVVCLKPFDFPEQSVFSSEYTTMDQQVVTSGIIKVPPGSAVMKYAWNVCQSKDPKLIEWGETGPKLMQDAVLRFDMQIAVKKAITFCPIPFFRWPEMILPGRQLSFDPETRSVHLWNEVWRRFDADKDAEYPKDCIYELLKSMYL